MPQTLKLTQVQYKELDSGSQTSTPHNEANQKRSSAGFNKTNTEGNADSRAHFHEAQSSELAGSIIGAFKSKKGEDEED